MKNGFMRKILVTAAALAVALAVLPLSALASPAETASPGSDFEWRYMGETIQLKRYIGSGGDVVIPAVYEGLPVVSIASDAFRNIRNVKSVVIPDGVTEIGSRAFCESTLTDIVIPDSVTSIALGCFQESDITSVILPKRLKSIEKYLFMDCKKLVSVVIPDGMALIKESAFEGAVSLLDVTIPGSVLEIAKRAFFGCTGLRNVIIGEGVSFIRDYAFQNCENLNSMYVPATVTSIGILTFVRSPVTLYIHKNSEAEYYVTDFAAAMQIAYRYVNPLVPDAMTSDTLAVDGDLYLAPGRAAEQVIDDINEREYIKIYKDAAPVGSETKVGTGMTIQLMDGGLIKQSITVIVTGDLNGDGLVTAGDALMTLQCATGKISLSPVQEQAAKAGGQNTVAASDALLILQFATGKIQSFSHA